MTIRHIHIARTAPATDSDYAVRRGVVDKLVADCRARGVPLGPRFIEVMERFATGKFDIDHLHHEMRIAVALEKSPYNASTCEGGQA